MQKPHKTGLEPRVLSTHEYSHKNVCGYMWFYAVPASLIPAVLAVPEVSAVLIPAFCSDSSGSSGSDSKEHCSSMRF